MWACMLPSFRRNCSLHLHDKRLIFREDWGSRFLRNVGDAVHSHTAPSTETEWTLLLNRRGSLKSEPRKFIVKFIRSLFIPLEFFLSADRSWVSLIQEMAGFCILAPFRYLFFPNRTFLSPGSSVLLLIKVIIICKAGSCILRFHYCFCIPLELCLPSDGSYVSLPPEVVTFLFH